MLQSAQKGEETGKMQNFNVLVDGEIWATRTLQGALEGRGLPDSSQKNETLNLNETVEQAQTTNKV